MEINPHIPSGQFFYLQPAQLNEFGWIRKRSHTLQMENMISSEFKKHWVKCRRLMAFIYQAIIV